MGSEVWISVIKRKQQGYVLLDCLIGLLILSTVTLSLIQALPVMLEAKQRLDTEQVLYDLLYEYKDQQQFYDNNTSLSASQITVPFRISHTDTQVCATYKWRMSHEKTICL